MMRLTAVLLVSMTLPLAGQWLSYPDARTPRTQDGKPDLGAPAPRQHGKPDLSGLWQDERTPLSELTNALGATAAQLQVDLSDLTKHAINVFWGLKPAEEPLRPEARAIMKQRAHVDSPASRCLPSGVPADTFIYPNKWIMTPQETVILSGSGDPPRQIYTDGRSLPKDPDPTWTGYSVGRWEGDTLAVDTTGFNERAWLDLMGHPRSESMHILERYRRRDFGHMDLEVTIDDPKYYTRPFTFRTVLNLVPDSDVLEYVCNEDEKDVVHTAATQ